MSLGRLNGKKVLITASAQGIGRASAITMAKEGAQVIATDKNDNKIFMIFEKFLWIKILLDWKLNFLVEKDL